MITRRRHLYLTTNDTRKIQTFTHPAGFERKVPAKEQPQTQALDRGYWDWQRYVLFYVNYQ